MKISNKKFMSLLTSVGLSTSMILSGCSSASNHDYITIDGKKRKLEEKDGQKGYYNNHGAFIPYVSPKSSSSSSGLTGGTKSTTGSKGLGTATKGGAGS